MSHRLTDKLNSRYIEAANRLKPRSAARRVVVYVESYDDILFWRSVLDEFESDRVHFQVMLPSRDNLSKGKKNAMMNRLGPSLGDCMIACVDADYDYLMQGSTPSSREMLENPFVFHTYVYAIENYQCYAKGLHEACVMSVLNDRQIINFEAFLQEYSRIIWPLFLWSVWVYRYDCYEEFTLMDFSHRISFREFNIYHPERTLEYVRRKVNRHQNWLQNHFPQGKATLAPLREELLSLGLSPETTYLYIQGHCLFEGVVMPMLLPVCTHLRKERETEIRNLACHEKQMQNELASYQHSQSPIEVMLKKNSYFLSSPVFERLRQDLTQFVNNL